MVIVPLDEASKAIYGEGKHETNTTTTEGTFSINANEFGELKGMTAPWDLLGIDNSWMGDIPRSITGTLKLTLKDKIDAALGFTHYVKKGKLYRK